jgi:hypothetical protein
VPWGRWEGAVPGYPAAAARLFNTSHNVEKTLTDSRPTDGRVKAKSGCHALKRATLPVVRRIWTTRNRNANKDLRCRTPIVQPLRPWGVQSDPDAVGIVPGKSGIAGARPDQRTKLPV